MVRALQGFGAGVGEGRHGTERHTRSGQGGRDGGVGLAEKYQVGGFPTIYFFRKGKHEEYNGGRTEAEIVQWVEENTGPTLHSFEKEEELETFLANRSHAVTAFIGTGGGDELKNLMNEISEEEHRTLGAVFLHMPGAGSPSVRLLRGFKEEKKFDGDHTSKDALTTWFKNENIAMVGQIDESNYEAYLATGQEGMVWLCFTPSELKQEVEKHMTAMQAASAKLVSAHKLRLVWLDTEEYEEHAKEELGCSQYPTLVVHLGDLSSEEVAEQVKKYKKVLGKEITADEITNFVDSCKKGEVEPIDELDEVDDEDEDEEEGGEKEDEDEKEEPSEL